MALEHGSEDFVVSLVPVLAEVSAVGENVTAGFVIQIPDITEKGVVVVGAGVRNAVVVVVVGQMGRAGITEECELQDSHAGEAAVLYQLCHFGSDVAQVFRNQQFVGADFTECVDQIHAGTLDPFAVFRCLFTGRDAEIGFQTAEMVDADAVKQLAHETDPVLPPGKSVFFHFVPVVQRIVPYLTVRAEVIRGYPCDAGRLVVFVKLELPGSCPYIGRIESHINRNIPDDGDALFVGVILDFLPLTEESVLHELPQVKHFFVNSFACPLGPGQIVIGSADCHESAEIVGTGMLGEEFFDAFGIGAALCRLVQQSETFFGKPLEFTAVGSFLLCFVDFRFGEKSFFLQQGQINEVGIDGEGTEGAVGGVVLVGKTEGKGLPVGETAVGEEIDPVLCCLTEAAFGVVAPEG